MDFTATYSPEDNKLRFTASERLDDDLYNRVKKLGFKWAPVQQLFVAGRWTPAREDLCIELAGSIEAEQTTMIDRAEDKIARIEGYLDRSEQKENGFHTAAREVAARFEFGQPILVGHHSERKARKDQERIAGNMDNAEKERKKQEYYQYLQAGVAYHANGKSCGRTRQNRIKKLLAELRDNQRTLNHARICLSLWQDIQALEDTELREKQTKYYSGGQLRTGEAVPYSYSTTFYNGEISVDDLISKTIENNEKILSSKYYKRWIMHILNRLGYETAEQGETASFEGKITAGLLQTFVRTHGAHKPKATKEGDSWRVISSVELPLHIAAGENELTLTAEAWADLMQACGYTVPEALPKKPSILNFKAKALKGQRWNSEETLNQVEMTKEEYAAINPDYRRVHTAICGTFRFKYCIKPGERGWKAEWVSVFLTNSKIHDAPNSNSIVKDEDQDDA